jgi:hypothetical protein
LARNTTASYNTAVGFQAGYSNDVGSKNTFVGTFAGLDFNPSSALDSRHTFVGYTAGENVSTGIHNTFIGSDSGNAVTTGSSNTILGRYNGNQGGLDIRTSSNNIVLSDGDGNPRYHINSSGRHFLNAASDIGSNSAVLRLNPNGSSYYGIVLKNISTNLTYAMKFFNSVSTEVGSIAQSNTGVTYNTSSDYRLKENVADLTGATERLKQLEPKRFNFIADADTTVDGFIAHEVQSVVPEAITGTKDAVDADGNPVYQGIDQSKLVPLLVATIQELEARITALEAN